MIFKFLVRIYFPVQVYFIIAANLSRHTLYIQYTFSFAAAKNDVGILFSYVKMRHRLRIVA